MLYLSAGFESILEGLFGPELVEDLKLFKGKYIRAYFCIIKVKAMIIEFSGLSIMCYLLIMTMLLHCTIWYPSTFTVKDSPSGCRREDALCAYKVGVLDGEGPV